MTAEADVAEDTGATKAAPDASHTASLDATATEHHHHHSPEDTLHNTAQGPLSMKDSFSYRSVFFGPAGGVGFSVRLLCIGGRKATACPPIAHLRSRVSHTHTQKMGGCPRGGRRRGFCSSVISTLAGTIVCLVVRAWPRRPRPLSPVGCFGRRARRQALSLRALHHLLLFLPFKPVVSPAPRAASGASGEASNRNKHWSPGPCARLFDGRPS